MSEVLFYHLTQSPVEATLPNLLERSLDRDWKVVVRGTDQARLEALDRHLWTFREDSFLPHGLSSDANSALQPIVLTTESGNPNSGSVLMLLDGAMDEPDALKRFERVCIFFDGNDPEAVSESRNNWTKLKDAGLAVKYWAQEDGRWVQKG